jgi:hypothetical protein
VSEEMDQKRIRRDVELTERKSVIGITVISFQEKEKICKLYMKEYHVYKKLLTPLCEDLKW